MRETGNPCFILKSSDPLQSGLTQDELSTGKTDESDPS